METLTLQERFAQPVPAFVGALQIRVINLFSDNPMIRMMGEGDKASIRQATRQAVELFWPIVGQFPDLVRGTGKIFVSSIKDAPKPQLLALIGSVRDIWDEIADEEEGHRGDWFWVARELFANLDREFKNPYIAMIAEALRSKDARTRLTALAAVEVNAVAWSELMRRSRQFTAALSDRSSLWWSVDHPLHLEGIEHSHLGLLVKMLHAAGLLEETKFCADIMTQTTQFSNAWTWNSN